MWADTVLLLGDISPSTSLCKIIPCTQRQKWLKPIHQASINILLIAIEIMLGEKIGHINRSSWRYERHGVVIVWSLLCCYTNCNVERGVTAATQNRDDRERNMRGDDISYNGDGKQDSRGEELSLRTENGIKCLNSWDYSLKSEEKPRPTWINIKRFTMAGLNHRRDIAADYRSGSYYSAAKIRRQKCMTGSQCQWESDRPVRS